MVARTSPDSTASPTATLMVATVPSCGATTGISIFMASSTSNVCPRFTASPSFTLISRITARKRRLMPDLLPATAGRLTAGRRSCRRSSCRTEYRFDFRPGLLFHFHGIGRSVYFYMHVIVFYISHGHLVEISVDFISVFFHGFRYTLEVISYERFTQGINLGTPR